MTCVTAQDVRSSAGAATGRAWAVLLGLALWPCSAFHRCARSACVLGAGSEPTSFAGPVPRSAVLVWQHGVVDVSLPELAVDYEAPEEAGVC